MEEQSGSTAAVSVAAPQDVALRLQALVIGWRGVERGQPLAVLHQECQQAAGPGGRALLPHQVRLVKDLGTGALKTTLKSLNGGSRSAELRYRVAPIGRFDAALVPIGQTGKAPDRWLLALEEALPLSDQVALYAHALGHLLLNRETGQMGRLPPLDPGAGYTHTELLGELRQLEQTRSPVDRRVLETYPSLSALLQAPEERGAALSFIAPDFRERLAQSGWRGHLVESPYSFTDGRIFINGATIHRRGKLSEDALLRAETSLPLALVHLLRSGEARAAAERRLIDYARDRLCLPFAYLLADDGAVQEFDWTASREAAPTRLSALPSRNDLWQRWTTALGLADAQALDALKSPYDLSAGHRPRYYQEAAINRAVAAVLQARRGLRQPRILLTLATGTGKTLVAFEIVWKLKRQARAVKNVLYLTDRDYLLKQAMDNDFAPFGDARYRIQGEVHTSHDLLFATYQAIADQEGRSGLYRGYPRNFFDLIIVDECHRGSAQEDSNWRAILEYFESAVQIGMTATPLRNENIQTYTYFGAPLMTYSLRQGINDGFLAPYRVRRVLLGTAAEAEADALAAAAASDEATGNAPTPLPLPADAVVNETIKTLRERTSVIADHLARYLQSNDPMAKTIVFCVDQAHAEDMRRALAGRSANLVRRYPDYLARIVSEEGDDGRRALGRFGTPDEARPVVVTTSKLLSTGVDVPTCKLIVLARPVGSMVEFKQIIGRGTRLHEKKQWFTIIDYAGATHHFFDQEFDGDPELVEVEPILPEPPPAAAPEEASAVETAFPTRAGASPEEPPAPAGTIKDGSASYLQGETDAAAQPPANPPEQVSSFSQPNEAPDGAVTVPEWGHPGAARSGDLNRQTWPSAPPAREKNGSGGLLPPLPPEAPPPIQTSSGRSIVVIGEIVYELGPDGSTLRVNWYQDYTKDALQALCATPAELRARWLHREQREEIKERLVQEGVDLGELAGTLRLPDADPFDLLLHVAFGERPLTRRERANRLKREHAAFFEHYGAAAREILEAVLAKYLAGEAEDMSDTELLKVPPLSNKGTFVELARRFGGGEQARQALREMHTLLYSA